MSDIIDTWEQLRVMVEMIDLDIRKNAVKGNKSAGTRARKDLRKLKSMASDLVKLSLESDKARKAASE